jgi:hypothetical protein
MTNRIVIGKPLRRIVINLDLVQYCEIINERVTLYFAGKPEPYSLSEADSKEFLEKARTSKLQDFV